MRGFVEERAVLLGEYIVKERTTVRAAARKFSVSKSTVHTDVSERLRDVDRDLFDRVRDVLDENKAQRHIRGGIATKEKYRNLKEHPHDERGTDRLHSDAVRC